jgi:outer membrane protein insertion porin family
LLFAQLVPAQFLDSPELLSASNTLREIRILGNTYVNERTIRNKIGLQDGQSYAPAVLRNKVQSSVRSLYKSFMFDDVSVAMEYVENSSDVILIYTVKELPALDTVLVKGHNELTDEDILPLLDLQYARVYSRAAVERDKQAILDLYKEKGFLLAEISIEEQVDSETLQTTLIFHIHEGQKVMVSDIVIHGANQVEAEEIISAMGSEIDRWYTEGEYNRQTFDSDVDSVLLVAKSHGFLDAAVTDHYPEYVPDSTFKFYRGRLFQEGVDDASALELINSHLQSGGSVLQKVASQASLASSHYHRQFRSRASTKQALPVPLLVTEDDAVEVLNRIIALSKIRIQYIEAHKTKTIGDSLVDSLLQAKTLNAPTQMYLTRRLLEFNYPSLARYAEVNASSKVVLNVHLQEGRRYYAGNFAFLGNEVLSSPMLQSRVTLDSGDVFDYREYVNMQMNMMNLYREDGYLFANIQEEKKYENDSIMHVTFRVREGLPASVNKVYITNNTRTKDKVIRREIKLFPGDTYRQSLMERSFRDVMQLNFFDNVMPDIQPVSEQEVDLVFDISEREAGTGTFSAGMAFSQADGLVGTLGLSIPNCCMGDGRRAELNLEYGADKKNFTLGFTEPWLFDRPVTLGGTANYTWYRGTLYDEDIIRWGFTAFSGRRLTWPDDYFYAQASYSFQVNQQGNNIDNSLILNSGLESSIGASISRDDKNLPMFPSEGSRYSLSTRYYGVGGHFDYWKNTIGIKWWFPIIQKLALGIESETGFISGSAIQYNSLYRMGGMLGYQGKLRGYSPGSIGYRRLGRSFQSFVAELTYPVAENRFYLLGFFDAGNVFGEIYNPAAVVSKDVPSPVSEWDPSDLYRDYGFGFRVIVPMLGIIGFDFGWPLDPGENFDGTKKDEVGGMEFNFVIGQPF